MFAYGTTSSGKTYTIMVSAQQKAPALRGPDPVPHRRHPLGSTHQMTHSLRASSSHLIHNRALQGVQRDPGMVPLALAEVFRLACRMPKRVFQLQLSMLEIYNEVSLQPL